MQSQLVWQIMHKRTVSIKRTVCKNCHMTLLKVQYDLDIKMIESLLTNQNAASQFSFSVLLPVRLETDF